MGEECSVGCGGFYGAFVRRVNHIDADFLVALDHVARHLPRIGELFVIQGLESPDHCSGRAFVRDQDMSLFVARNKEVPATAIIIF